MRSEEEIRELLKLKSGIEHAAKVLATLGAFPLEEKSDKFDGFVAGIECFGRWVLNEDQWDKIKIVTGERGKGMSLFMKMICKDNEHDMQKIDANTSKCKKCGIVEEIVNGSD